MNNNFIFTYQVNSKLQSEIRIPHSEIFKGISRRVAQNTQKIRRRKIPFRVLCVPITIGIEF